MKKLIIARHAKAETNASVDDLSRPLTNKGENESNRLAGYLNSANCFPNVVFCSNAARSKQTAAIIKTFSSKLIVFEIPELYQASPSTLLDFIHNISPDFTTAMIVGHNPGVQELSLLLSDNNPSEAALNLKLGFHTACAAIFNFENIKTWNEVSQDHAKLSSFFCPVLP